MVRRAMTGGPGSEVMAADERHRRACRGSAYLRVVGVARRGGGLDACGGRQLLMPISAREVCRAGCRVGAASDGSFQSGARRLPRLRRNRERVKANPVRSGCGELELAQGVEGALADLA